jgi:hypothetical protein
MHRTNLFAPATVDSELPKTGGFHYEINAETTRRDIESIWRGVWWYFHGGGLHPVLIKRGPDCLTVHAQVRGTFDKKRFEPVREFSGIYTKHHMTPCAFGTELQRELDYMRMEAIAAAVTGGKSNGI